MKKTAFDISIRCHYPNGESTNHHQALKLSEIPKWLEAYKFTHPHCKSISVKIWFTDLDKSEYEQSKSRYLGLTCSPWIPA